LSANFAQQQTRNAGFASLSGWEASGGITTSLNSHMTLSGQYVYLHDGGNYAGVFNTFSVQSIRLSLGWAPQFVQR
jgi:opacity protein-like surface antigen